MTEPQPHGPARATAPISEAETSPRAAAFGRALARLLGRSSSGPAIAVTDASGTFVVGKGVPTLSVTVHDERAYLATLRRGSQGFAESYIDEWWDTDDLTGVVRSVMRGVDPMLSKLDWWTAKLLGPLTLWHRRQRPTKDHDLRNVRAHYDLPGELYEVMLDPTMLYSCALFGEDPFDLEGAQIAKMERICSALELNESDHLLEIGTGWGGFAIYAATLMATDETIQRNPDLTRRFLRAAHQSLTWSRDNQVQACQIHVRANPEVEQDDCEGSLRAVMGFVFNEHQQQTGLGRAAPDRLAFTWRVVAESQQLDASWNPAQAVDTSLLP